MKRALYFVSVVILMLILVFSVALAEKSTYNVTLGDGTKLRLVLDYNAEADPWGLWYDSAVVTALQGTGIEQFDEQGHLVKAYSLNDLTSMKGVTVLQAGTGTPELGDNELPISLLMCGAVLMIGLSGFIFYKKRS